MSEIKKIVTAYSGGLDTSCMIPWLSEAYGGAEIYGFTGDLGQGALGTSTSWRRGS